MSSFDAIRKNLERFTPLGSRRMADGAELIGHMPSVAPEAFLHEIYPGLTVEEANNVEKQLGLGVPRAFLDFLTQANGLYLFSGALSIYGVRKSVGRSIDGSRQPYDLSIPNREGRPGNAGENLLFVGFYDWDGSQLYLDTATGAAHVWARDSGPGKKIGPDFWAALISESERLTALFDARGQQIDPSRPTSPA